MEYHHFAQFSAAIRTPTYKLANKPLTNNEYTVKDSFSFAKDVLEFDASFLWQVVI